MTDCMTVCMMWTDRTVCSSGLQLWLSGRDTGSGSSRRTAAAAACGCRWTMTGQARGQLASVQHCSQSYITYISCTNNCNYQRPTMAPPACLPAVSAAAAAAPTTPAVSLTNNRYRPFSPRLVLWCPSSLSPVPAVSRPLLCLVSRLSPVGLLVCWSVGLLVCWFGCC